MRSFLFSLLLLPVGLSSQTVFSMAWPLTVNLMHNNLEQTSNGGYILCADEPAIFDTVTNLNWCYMIKVNPNGSTQWIKRFGKADAAAKARDGNSVCETYDGGFAVATAMYTHAPSINNSYSAIYVVRTNSSGNLLWSYTYPGVGNSSAYCIAETADHGLIVCGSTIDTMVSQTKNYLLRLDSAGNVLWGKSYAFAGMGFNSKFITVKETSDGGLITCGDLSGNSVLMKTDASGNPLWCSSVPGSYAFENDVEEIPGGGFITCGYRTNFWGGFVNRYDSAGNLLWTKSYPPAPGSPTSGFDQPYAVDIVDDGYTVAITNTDNILMHLDTSGQIVWRRSYGTSHAYRPMDLVHTSDNGYAFSGMTFTGPNAVALSLHKTDSMGIAFCADTLLPDSIGPVTFLPSFVTVIVDTATHRMNQPTVISPFNLPPTDLCHDYAMEVPTKTAEPQLHLFPNPTDNQLTIQWQPDFRPEHLHVVNSCGQVIYSVNTINVRQNQQSIDTSDWPAGIYLVTAETREGNRITHRIVVLH